jgi:hypothetical protein
MTLVPIVLLVQLANFAPSPAPEGLVVHFEFAEGLDAASSGRSIVYRSGSLIHTDSTIYGDRTASEYVDRARGRFVTASRDRNGALLRVSVWIDQSASQARRIPTGRHDRALGEDCTIWRLMDPAGLDTEICETADGIPLWEAFWYPRPDDRTVMYQRAIAIERRSVGPAELLPPRNLLALALALAPLSPVQTVAAEPDYEVEMVADDPADGTYVTRRHGRFSSIARHMPGQRSLQVSNGTISVFYEENETGQPRSLEIRRRGERRPSRWVPVAGRPVAYVLGETCTWQEDAAFGSTDPTQYCRTADGIPLKRETYHEWTGHTERFTAHHVSRGLLNDADFAPPARILDWAFWGISPAS